MAAPTVANKTEGKEVTGATSFTISFTQTTGDLVVIGLAIAVGQVLSTVGDSFTDFSNRNGTFHVLYKVLDGTEGGNCVVTVASTSKGCWGAWNIQGQHASSAPELSTIATGTEGVNGTAPNSNSLTASWGNEENLWLSMFKQNGEELDDDTWITATPTNYSAIADSIQKTSDTGGVSSSNCQHGASSRAATTATEDPGAFTVAQDRSWEAYTVVIRPAAAGGATQPPRSMHQHRMRAA